MTLLEPDSDTQIDTINRYNFLLITLDIGPFYLPNGIFNMFKVSLVSQRCFLMVP